MHRSVRATLKNSLFLLMSFFSLAPVITQKQANAQGQVIGESTRPPEMSLANRVKSLERILDQVTRDTALNFELYKFAMSNALLEAQTEIQIQLPKSVAAQQCSRGEDRKRSCLYTWNEANKILDAALARHGVAGHDHEFAMRPNQISRYVQWAGALDPCPNVDSRQNIIRFMIEDHRITKCQDLQDLIANAILRSGNAVISHSSASIASRALLAPMQSVTQLPPSEKVDVTTVLSKNLHNVRLELNAASVEPLDSTQKR